MPDDTSLRDRKVEHLRINLEENVQFSELGNGLRGIALFTRRSPRSVWTQSIQG